MQAAEQSNSLETPKGRDLDAILQRIDQFAGEYEVYTHPALYQTASGIKSVLRACCKRTKTITFKSASCS